MVVTLLIMFVDIVFLSSSKLRLGISLVKRDVKMEMATQMKEK